MGDPDARSPNTPHTRSTFPGSFVVISSLTPIFFQPHHARSLPRFQTWRLQVVGTAGKSPKDTTLARVPLRFKSIHLNLTTILARPPWLSVLTATATITTTPPPWRTTREATVVRRCVPPPPPFPGGPSKGPGG